MSYYRRLVDAQLLAWKSAPEHKPLLLRGARQVGKSSAVRELGHHFRYFVEVNLEARPSLRSLFTEDIDVRRLCTNLSATLNIPIIAGETLLFIDEIQTSRAAMMSLRYFRENWPELHVIAAGSLLEFTLSELPSFAVGRIRSLYMYPFSFDEFLLAQGLEQMVTLKRSADSAHPLAQPLHEELVAQLRAYLLVGGMPAAVSEWVSSHDYTACRRTHSDILDTYQDDFAKYKSRQSPTLLRQMLRSVALQSGQKFVLSRAAQDTRASVVSDALRLLTRAGLIVPVLHSDGTGIPLGAEVNERCAKYLFVDTGLLLTMLHTPAAEILLTGDGDLVNKGPIAEVFAGLELLKYSDCFTRGELYYWQNTSRNGNAEVDYLHVQEGKIVPLEVKSNTRGSMQSLYLFMHKRHLSFAIRSSLEPFGQFVHTDAADEGSKHHIHIVPLYALSSLCQE